MTYLIALSAGHGLFTNGKRTPAIPELNNRVIKEFEFNNEVVKLLKIELERCGFETLLVYNEKEDTPLRTRTNLANSKKADAYISIHYNALDGKFDGNDPEGHSLHIHPGSASGRKLASCIGKYLKEGTPQKYRGIVEQNLHETRETNMVAVLSENGFMDNKREALLMVNKDFQKEVAIEHAKGICDYFNVPYTPPTSPAKTPSKWEQEVAEAVKFVQEHNISDGTNTGETLTRGQFFVILHRLHKGGKLK
jgi:N-acetylmuramoyl-L-alanine amidase